MELDAQVNRHNNRDKVLLFLGVYSVLNVRYCGKAGATDEN